LGYCYFLDHEQLCSGQAIDLAISLFRGRLWDDYTPTPVQLPVVRLVACASTEVGE
jgi:hypothetical protein